MKDRTGQDRQEHDGQNRKCGTGQTDRIGQAKQDSPNRTDKPGSRNRAGRVG